MPKLSGLTLLNLGGTICTAVLTLLIGFNVETKESVCNGFAFQMRPTSRYSKCLLKKLAFTEESTSNLPTNTATLFL